MDNGGSCTKNMKVPRNAQPNDDCPVLSDSSVNKNSAGILSIWHCILTRYFVESEGGANSSKEEKTHTMIEIYRHMKHLRLAIHGNDNNPDFISIDEIAKPFNSMFSLIPIDAWIVKLESLVQEVATMRDTLAEIKEMLQVSDDRIEYDIAESSDDDQPRDIISVLTLWYWFAACSSLDQPINNNGAKDEFIDAMEVHDKMMGFLLAGNSQIQLKEKQELQILLSKLFQMLKSDPQYWTDLLSRFIRKMLSTPEAPETLVTSPMHLRLKPVPVLGGWWKFIKKGAKEIGKIGISEGIMEAIKNPEAIVDGVKDLANGLANGIKKLAS